MVYHGVADVDHCFLTPVRKQVGWLKRRKCSFLDGNGDPGIPPPLKHIKTMVDPLRGSLNPLVKEWLLITVKTIETRVVGIPGYMLCPWGWNALPSGMTSMPWLRMSIWHKCRMNRQLRNCPELRLGWQSLHNRGPLSTNLWKVKPYDGQTVINGSLLAEDLNHPQWLASWSISPFSTIAKLIKVGRFLLANLLESFWRHRCVS